MKQLTSKNARKFSKTSSGGGGGRGVLIDDVEQAADVVARQRELREQILTTLRESLKIAVEKRRFFQKPPHRNLNREREWAKLVEMISTQINTVLSNEDPEK